MTWRDVTVKARAALLALLAAMVAAVVAAVPQHALAAMPETVVSTWLTSPGDFSFEGDAYHVKTVRGWYYFAAASKEYDFEDDVIVLDDDLDFSGLASTGGDSWEAITGGSDNDAFTVGGVYDKSAEDDLSFKGTFDGGGHTLSGFDNHRDGLLLQVNCGFFGYTNRAVIKNVTFRDCYVGSTYSGAVVVGSAKDTFLLNISCVDCTSSIVPGNPVLSLITNAGLRGGMIVGEADGTTLYNCEMLGGRVVTNTTTGVEALGGQPIFLGGLVGAANDSVIEYCRVDSSEGSVPEVKNSYSVSVPVVSFTEVFTGGIVGMIQGDDTGTKVVDCFCTAKVRSESIIYFGVGLGITGATRGYTGGIVGTAYDPGDGQNLIQRVSFAGDLSAYNRNIALLGIPVYEYDKYMGGIVGHMDKNVVTYDDTVTVDQAYFKRSASETEEDILAVRNYEWENSGYADGTAFGPRDESYAERSFWEECDFDTAGGELRSVGYPFTPGTRASEWDEDHYNKWVMDYPRGIPVHGGSVKATMDFPGSGTVTIDGTSLSGDPSPETTSDPYDFAVQGYREGDPTVKITFEANKNDDPTAEDYNKSWASDALNKGFRFMGWYRSRDVRVNDLSEDHSLFTEPRSLLNTEGSGLLSDKYRVPGEGSEDPVLTVNAPDTEVADDAQDDKAVPEYADNDLYVAYAQANVLLHDAEGDLIDENGAAQEGVAEGDWYDYGDVITLPRELPAGLAPSADALLVGWTTDEDYAGVQTSTELSACKSAGTFYEPGAAFAVERPANLYPVYADYSASVSVIYEGHERIAPDTKDVVNVRQGFGKAQVLRDDEGSLYLAVIPCEDSPVLDRTVRFLGWYENKGTEEDPLWIRVSKGGDFPSDVTAGSECFAYALEGVDLTEPHTYMARFEYQVTYYYYSGSSDIYAQEWAQYGSEFNYYTDIESNQNILGVGHVVSFASWRLGTTHDDGASYGDAQPWENEDAKQDAEIGQGWKVNYPLDVHAHWEDDHDPSVTEGSGDYLASADFPGSGDVTVDRDNLRPYASISVNSGYAFHWWEVSNERGGYRDVTESTSADPIYATAGPYRAEARMTADVTFQFPSTEDATVQRRYRETILRDGDYTWNLSYYYGGSSGTITTCSTANMDATAVSDAPEGYAFLGWVDWDALSEGERSYLFSGEPIGANQITPAADATRALPYLLTKGQTTGTGDTVTNTGDLCYRAMTLYPVYARFDVETTTNIAQAGVEATTYAIPGDPGVSDGCVDNNIGTVRLSYNNDDGTLVAGASNPIDLSYDATGTALVRIIVDEDVPLWANGAEPEGPEGETYEFVSLSVLDGNGNEVDTLLPDEMNEGAFSYAIEAGRSYTFRANYAPVPVLVTYHLGEATDAQESYSCEVGDRVPATSSRPSFAAYDTAADQSWFFVGWTQGEKDGAPSVYAEGLPLISSGSTVTGTMHLWPVYRAGNVTVRSNIDDVANAAVSASKHEGDPDGLWIEASEVEGYVFVGWTTKDDYPVSDGDFSAFEPEFSGTSRRLSGDARFDGTTYTAVYRSMDTIPKVQYHDTDGSVLYTAYAMDDDADRTFFELQRVPETDESGNIKYDEDGNVIFKQEESVDDEGNTIMVDVLEPAIVDSEAFNLVRQSLASKNEERADGVYEEFLTWQWVKGDGTSQRWGTYSDEEAPSNFVNQKVSVNATAKEGYTLHLYPVTVTLEATGPGGDGYTDLRPSFTMSEDGTKLVSAQVTLESSYSEAWLKVHIDEVAYGKDYEGAAPSPQTGIPVELYTPGSQVGSPVATDTTRAGKDDSGVIALEAGDALFTFSGRITITKRTTDPKAAGQTFAFTVRAADGTESRTVSVTVGDTASNGVFSGMASIRVPFGSYMVSEDAAWAWRYDATIQTWASSGSWVDDGTVTVAYDSIVSANNPDGVTSAILATNVREKDQWLDDGFIAHNVFGRGASGGGAQDGGEA